MAGNPRRVGATAPAMSEVALRLEGRRPDAVSRSRAAPAAGRAPLRIPEGAGRRQHDRCSRTMGRRSDKQAYGLAGPASALRRLIRGRLAGIVRAEPDGAMGRSQAVRQRILIPPFPGSNPGAPANNFKGLACHHQCNIDRMLRLCRIQLSSARSASASRLWASSLGGNR